VTLDGVSGLDIGFIDHLYTPFGGTSDYSAIANQITTVPAKPCSACCVLTSRSLTTATILQLNSLNCFNPNYQLRNSTDLASKISARTTYQTTVSTAIVQQHLSRYRVDPYTEQLPGDSPGIVDVFIGRYPATAAFQRVTAHQRLYTPQYVALRYGKAVCFLRGRRLTFKHYLYSSED
jgi:hypothetical protein